MLRRPTNTLQTSSLFYYCSYFGNHSDAAGVGYHPLFATGYDLLVLLLQLQPEIMDQLLANFLEGKPFKAVGEPGKGELRLGQGHLQKSV